MAQWPAQVVISVPRRHPLLAAALVQAPDDDMTAPHGLCRAAFAPLPRHLGGPGSPWVMQSALLGNYWKTHLCHASIQTHDRTDVTCRCGDRTASGTACRRSRSCQDLRILGGPK